MKSNIWKYYAFTFFRYLIFFITVFYLFYQGKGLSATLILSLLAIRGFVSLVMEIPSGIFADFYGRKISMALGALLIGIASISISLSNTYTFFVLFIALYSLGVALASGADTAFLYDTLKSLKREKEFKKISGRAFAMMSISFALAGLLGGYIARSDLGLTYFFSGLSALIAFLIALSFTEPKVYKKLVSKNYLSHFKKSIVFAFTHKIVRWLILFDSIIFGTMFVLFNFFQPYMLEIGIKLENFGYYYFAFLVFSALVSYYAHKLESKVGIKVSFILIASTLFIPLLIMPFTYSIFGIILILMMQFSHGYILPVISDYFNKRLESNKRATITSIAKMGQNIAFIIISLIAGVIADAFTIRFVFLLSGIFIFIAFMMFLPSILSIKESSKSL